MKKNNILSLQNHTLSAILGLCILTMLIVTVASRASGDEIHKMTDELPNLGLLKDEIRQYYSSGKCESDRANLVNGAIEFIEHYDAKGKKPAIVSDVDDTAVSNYEGLEKLDFPLTFDLAEVVMWFASAKDPVIPSTLRLFKKAKSMGIKFFFITGRGGIYRSMTEKNLREAGYEGYDGLTLEPDDYMEKSVVPFKSGERKKLAAAGYTIVVNIGDQMSDLEGGYGEYKVKLPNPMYYVR